MLNRATASKGGELETFASETIWREKEVVGRVRQQVHLLPRPSSTTTSVPNSRSLHTASHFAADHALMRWQESARWWGLTSLLLGEAGSRS